MRWIAHIKTFGGSANADHRACTGIRKISELNKGRLTARTAEINTNRKQERYNERSAFDFFGKRHAEEEATRGRSAVGPSRSDAVPILSMTSQFHSLISLFSLGLNHSESARWNDQRADRETSRCLIASGCAPTASPGGLLYIAMCATGSLQSPAPVLPPIAHNCSV